MNSTPQAATLDKGGGRPPRPSRRDNPPGGMKAAAASPRDPFVEIIDHARTHASKHRFLSAVLRSLAECLHSPYAALHVRYASEVVQDDWPIAPTQSAGPTDPAFWKPAVQQYLTESLAEPKLRARLLRAKTGASQVAFLSAPIFDPAGPAIGALAMVVTVADQADASRHLTTLEALTRLASFATEFVSARASHPSSSPQRAPISGSPGERPAATTVEELAFGITNELRNKFQCEQVAFGWVARGRVRLLSISGLDNIARRSPGVLCIQAAMEECLDAQDTISCQKDEVWSTNALNAGYRLHKQWRRAAKGDAVASLPLLSGGGVVAVLSLRRHPHQPLTREELQRIHAQIEPLIPTLLLVRQAGRGLLRHSLESVRHALAAVTRPGGYFAKAAAMLGMAATAWFLFGTLPYRVTLPCIVTVTGVRNIAAPFDAVLTAAPVVEGDFIHQGDLLCQFDSTDLQQQLAELTAQMAVLEVDMDRARANHAPHEARLAETEQGLIRAKLDIGERRIAQATVRAPMDGIVIAGDLRKRIGETMPRGEPLLTVAPHGHWRLELEAPEMHVRDISPEMTGIFTTLASPESRRICRVLRIGNHAQERDGRNVYIAEAEILPISGATGENTAGHRSSPPVRPGMQGFARIEAGRRPVWWIVSHRAIDFLRLHFWL